MTEDVDWWRRHLPETAEILWHGKSTQRPMLIYRVPYWIFKVVGGGGMALGILVLITGTGDGLFGIISGAFVFAISYVFKAFEHNWQNNTWFAVLPDKGVMITRKGIVDEVEIDAYLHFDRTQSGIHFPRRMGQWMFMDDPEGAYEGLKKAQRRHA